MDPKYQIKVTVIIPVYNVEKYLAKCIESVISQNLEEIEVFCIDDGSTDSSGKILDSYKSKDSRILVLHKQNEGVSAARNQGIKSARGKYVMFMDSDDYYPDDDVLRCLFDVAENTNVNVAGGEFSHVFSDGTIECSNKFRDDPFLFGYWFEKEGLTDYKDYQFDYGYHRFLYNREFLIKNGLFFPNLSRFQDPPFMVKVLAKAGIFYAIKKTTYRYRYDYREVLWTEKKVNDLVEGLFDIITFANENGYSKLVQLEQRRFSNEYGNLIRWTLANMTTDRQNIKKDLDEARQVISNLQHTQQELETEKQQVIEDMQRINNGLERELERTRNAISYRIGLIITVIPRKAYHLCDALFRKITNKEKAL